jgi:serine O-acetyltransferase
MRQETGAAEAIEDGAASAVAVDADGGVGLEQVVAELWRDAQADAFGGRRVRAAVPCPDVIEDVVEALRSVFFPGFFEVQGEGAGAAFQLGATLGRAMTALEEQVARGIALVGPAGGDRSAGRARAQAVVQQLIGRLPAVRKLVASDVSAALAGDPALQHAEEAVLCYPGVRAGTSQRIAHELYRLGVPLVPRIITELAHAATGIDIHPGAAIGERFFIDHGTGVVIGETAIIGDRVRVYQGVTLGAKSFPLDAHGNPIKGQPRHPIVEDDVVVYAGATILGRITVGKGSSIGGNVWVTSNVPPGTRVTQAARRDAAPA